MGARLQGHGDSGTGAGKFISFCLLAGWGAVEFYCPTHQLILREAYALLRKDSAFQGSPFPALDDILRNEGVTAANTSMLTIQAFGPGPDAEGASNYSDHYFNPSISLGFAPVAVLHYFSQLLNGSDADRGKGAAWASHFVADMAVPHHVVGMPREDAERVMQGLRPLTEADTGPATLYLADAPAGWGGNGDFSAATRNYLEEHAAGAADWYDPWYSNGTRVGASAEVGFSSHVSWEKRAHNAFLDPSAGIPQDAGAADVLYDLAWRNAAVDPTFNSNLALTRSEAAGAFASRVAARTRMSIDRFVGYPRESIRRAVTATVTVWRASFSGLRPQLELEPGWDPLNPFRRRVILRVGNAAVGAATDVIARFTVIFPDGQIRQSLGRVADEIPPGAEGGTVWGFEYRANGQHLLRAEVQASYRIPDLQYAKAEAVVRLGAPETEGLVGTWREDSLGRPGAKVMVVRIERPAGEYVGTVLRPERIINLQTAMLANEQSFFRAGQEIFRLQDGGGQQFRGSVVVDAGPGVKVPGRGWVYNHPPAWHQARAVWDRGDILKIYWTGYLFDYPQESYTRFIRLR